MTAAATSPPLKVGVAGRVSLLLVPSLSSLGFAGLAPILTQMGDHFASEPGAQTVIRSMVSTGGAAVAVGAPLAGLLAERVGLRPLLIWALLLFALAGTTGFFAENIWLLLASRILVGLAVAAVGVASSTLLTGCVAADLRNRWIGFYIVAGTFGGLTLIALSGWIGAGAWRDVFLLHLLGVPLALLVLFLIPAAERERAIEPDTPSSAGGGIPFGIFFLGLACGVPVATIPVYLPFHFKSIGILEPDRVAAAIISWSLASSLLALFYGKVRRHVGVTPVFVVAFVLMAFGLAGAASSTQFEWALLCMCLAGIGGGLTGPNLLALAAAAPFERRARRMGWARAGIFGAPLIAQIPLEPVALAFGAGGALFAMAAFSVAMLPVFLATRRTLEAANASS